MIFFYLHLSSYTLFNLVGPLSVLERGTLSYAMFPVVEKGALMSPNPSGMHEDPCC